MIFRTTFTAAALAVVLAAPAWGQDATPGALAAARELSDLVIKTGFRSAMVDPAWSPVEAAIRRSKADATPAQIAGVKDVFQKALLEETASAMEQVPALYAKHFTEDELRAIIAFYRTPVGVKALNALPQISGESIQIVMADLPKALPRIQARLQQALIDNGLGPAR